MTCIMEAHAMIKTWFCLKETASGRANP